MMEVKVKRVKKFRMKCESCGSEDVIGYASVYWDFDRQEWRHYDFTDQDDWCNACNCETCIEQITVYEDPPEWPDE